MEDQAPVVSGIKVETNIPALIAFVVSTVSAKAVGPAGTLLSTGRYGKRHCSAYPRESG